VGAIRLDAEPVLYPFDGAVDEEKFLSFLDRLLPTLKAGDVLIMDNCTIHKTDAVKDKLGTVGARPLFLPPYSPELNPIEETWSLVKGIFKSLEARTISAYIDVLDFSKAAITPQKIKAYFDHADLFLNQEVGVLFS
jgi:transposase